MSYRTQSAGEQGVRWPVVWIIALIGVLLSIPMEGFCLTWDFNVDEDFEGWTAYGRIVRRAKSRGVKGAYDCTPDPPSFSPVECRYGPVRSDPGAHEDGWG